MVQFRFKKTPRHYNICLGCHSQIVDIEQEVFDGEDYWHIKCKEEFDNKMFALIKKPPRVFTLRRLKNERG